MSELLTLSEGAVLTHLVTRAELTDGVLLAADDLRLWARLADGAGVPLAVGGLLRTSIDTGAPVLTGPEGWLAGVEPEDMIALRLRDGAFELSITELADFPAERTIRVVQEFGEQALDGLRAFAEGLEPSPGVPIDVVVLELLMKAPETFADPLPPLAPLLRNASLELHGGRVGIVGAPWDPASVADLTSLDIIRLTLVRSALRTYDEGNDLSKAITYLSRSEVVLARIADEVEREPLGPALIEALPRTEPAALLLIARSAEGEGRSFEAAELISEALFAAPDLALAQRDAAEYAACRTDPDAPLPERSAHLFRQLLTYLYRPARRSLIDDLIGLSVRVAEPALADLALFENDVVGEFLDARGEWLRDDETALLESWRRTPLRLWEVLDVAGEEITVREGEERVTLTDELLSQQALPGDLMLTRLLDDGAGPHVFGHPFKVDPERREEMLDLLTDPVDPYAVAAFFRRPRRPGTPPEGDGPV
ncbi:hypothetical protein SAMN05216276_1001209 [Streptosporangium subroseum]|uniref:Uncharacterized protein n=1 Tax=Streptosporangium subroseum TaxID=106412 RepID=A0A239AA68_9ACTN|nr:hypothetical protein [Streptosporangium subroseum]SNR91968.1 hypothetical protein SAMN05216276_1001209 [Streptosporangium subroseum]